MLRAKWLFKVSSHNLTALLVCLFCTAQSKVRSGHPSANHRISAIWGGCSCFATITILLKGFVCVHAEGLDNGFRVVTNDGVQGCEWPSQSQYWCPSLQSVFYQHNAFTSALLDASTLLTECHTLQLHLHVSPQAMRKAVSILPGANFAFNSSTF